MALRAARQSRGLCTIPILGGQYAATVCQQLRAAGIVGSMPRHGDCWDNACIEGFFSTLKRELIHHRQYRTRAEARHEIFEYSKCFTIGNAAIRRSATVSR